jgi:hypothetical protein
MSNLNIQSCFWSLLFVTGVSGCTDWDGTGNRQTDLPSFVLSEVNVFPQSGDLYDIRDIEVDEEGNIWVLSATEPFLYHFSADHRQLANAGRSGDGPGELRNPWSLVSVGTNPIDVVVWDVGRRQLSHFGNSLSPGKSHAVPVSSPSVMATIGSVSYGTPLRMKRLSGGYVFQQPTRAVSNSGDLTSLLLLRIDSTLTVVDTLFALTSTEAANASTERAEVFVSIPLWALCPDGEIVILDPSAEQLIRMDFDGETQTSEPLTLSRKKITEPERRSYLQGAIALELRGKEGPPPEMVERRIAEILTRGRHLFAEMAPPGVRLLCDGSGHAWLQEFDTANHPNGYGTRWQVYRGGADSVQVSFPDHFQPMQIVGDQAWGIYTDSMDVNRPASVHLSPDLRARLR